MKTTTKLFLFATIIMIILTYRIEVLNAKYTNLTAAIIHLQKMDLKTLAILNELQEMDLGTLKMLDALNNHLLLQKEKNK